MIGNLITYKNLFLEIFFNDSEIESALFPVFSLTQPTVQRAARKPQIVLFLTHVYDTKMYLKKLFDKRFRRIFSSAFQ